jgi:hypothetical protein
VHFSQKIKYMRVDIRGQTGLHTAARESGIPPREAQSVLVYTPGTGVLRRKLMSNWAKIVACLFFIAALQISPMQVSAQQRGPSTPQERARAVQTAKSLQADPLAADTQEDREWLVKWLIEVPDISVKLCTTFLSDLGDSKSSYPGAIIATMLASEAAFVIEHPEKAKDTELIYLAGVDGALNGYQVIRKKDASYRTAHLDDLIQMRDQGKLTQYVHATAKKCK